jgi:hypothetical protein
LFAGLLGGLNEFLREFDRREGVHGAFNHVAFDSSEAVQAILEKLCSSTESKVRPVKN